MNRRWWKEYHLRHNFEDGGMRFGIPSPPWDFVFGTYRELLGEQ